MKVIGGQAKTDISPGRNLPHQILLLGLLLGSRDPQTRVMVKIPWKAQAFVLSILERLKAKKGKFLQSPVPSKPTQGKVCCYGVQQNSNTDSTARIVPLHLNRTFCCTAEISVSQFGLSCCPFIILKVKSHQAHMLAGPRNPGVALIVKSCGTNISASVGDGALSHKIHHLTYLADPGKAWGCSINSLITDSFIKSVSKSAFSCHSFTVLPRPNGQRQVFQL